MTSTKFQSSGVLLRDRRERLDISIAEVATLSGTIAAGEGNREYAISEARLNAFETGSLAPGIYETFSLAAIYGIGLVELLSYYAVETEKIPTYHAQLPIRKTHIAEFGLEELPRAIDVPVRFDGAFNLGRTSLLSRMVAAWGDVPVEFLCGLDVKRRIYGFVGLEDKTMSPLIRPGSFLQIDPNYTVPRQQVFESEFDRPIYFFELPNEYMCAWCDIDGMKLILLGHPKSCSKSRTFDVAEVRIVGEVVGVAMKVGRRRPKRVEPSAPATQS